METSWLALALAPFAVYRISALIQNDEIFDAPRAFIHHRYVNNRKPLALWYFLEWVVVHCIWCLGVWTATAFTAAYWFWSGPLFTYLTFAAALSLAPHSWRPCSTASKTESDLMPLALIVLGFGLVSAGLFLGFGNRALERAGGEAIKGIKMEGPAWLILVALGAGIIVFGAWRFTDTQTTATPTPTTQNLPTTTTTPAVRLIPAEVSIDEFALDYRGFYEAEFDTYLDDLWNSCDHGDLQACDDLYFDAPIGSNYEWFGATCGARVEGYVAECTETEP